MLSITRILVTAAAITGASAMLATAQELLAPRAGPAHMSADRVHAFPAQFRDGRRGGRGALLGTFGPGGARDLFEAADENGDGALTQAEIDAFLGAQASQVSQAAADGDGDLTLDEFAPVYFERVRPRMVDAFQALDADGSGVVTAEELDDRFGDIVARLDRDGDDALTLRDRRGEPDDG